MLTGSSGFENLSAKRSDQMIESKTSNFMESERNKDKMKKVSLIDQINDHGFSDKFGKRISLQEQESKPFDEVTYQK